MTEQQYEQEAIERIKRHEGYKAQLYRDPLNYNIITGGYGHNFQELMTPKLAELILQYDIEIAKESLKQIFKYEALNRLPYHKYYVLVELAFQLGSTKLSKFKNMIAAINKGFCREAAEHLRDSNYYKQVPARAEELAKILEEN